MKQVACMGVLGEIPPPGTFWKQRTFGLLKQKPPPACRTIVELKVPCAQHGKFLTGCYESEFQV